MKNLGKGKDNSCVWDCLSFPKDWTDGIDERRKGSGRQLIPLGDR